MKEKLDSIASAIEEIRSGKVVIVVDDENRENEGDFIAAARNVTPEVINFMSKHGRGLICVALTEERCDELKLDMMVAHNTDPRKTAFTVSVDLLGHGCTTGISAHDRSKTVQALIDPTIMADDLARPGHIFPLRAKNGGVLRRTGHTEAAVDLAQLAGMEPAGALVEIMNDDGSMARLPQLMEIAEKFKLKIISIKDLIAHRLQTESLVERVTEIPFATAHGDFRLAAFRHKIDRKTHLALIKGEWNTDETVPVRVHSCNIIGDIFGVGQGEQKDLLHRAMQKIEAEGKGVLVYINHLQNERTLLDDIVELKREQEDSSSSKAHDALDFGTGAQILRSLGVRKMKLLTGHAVKRTGLEGYGLEISSVEAF